MDYQAHNQEVREVWDGFRNGDPIRMPVIVVCPIGTTF